MELLPGGHVARPGTSRLCPHLIVAADTDQVRLLTGRGLAYDLCCAACDEALRAGGRVELVVACEGCVDRCADDGEVIAWRGEPPVTDRPEPVDLTVVPVLLPVPVADIAPVSAATGSVWLLLSTDGRIGRFDADTGAWQPRGRCTVPDEPGHRPFAGQYHLRRRLHASPDGRFAAVVNDFGHHGQVLDLATGRVTMTLHGGGHRPYTVPFSLAFLRHDGRPLVIHRTAWNRLDVSDPATGRLLTARGPTSYRGDEPRPEHYLDYFHGGLTVSPGGRRIADDGWVWAPVGMPTVWDVGAWLTGNVWESEDGPSRLRLCHRAYHWNSPVCWLDDERVVISGIGDDDIALLPGVRVFAAATGAELAAFPGPAGALFAGAARLYAAGPRGLEIWDPVTGHRTGTVPGFTPAHHHRGAGELAQVDGDVLRRWRLRGQV